MPWREPNEQREPSSLLEWQSREEEDKVKWSDLFQSLLAHNSLMADLGLISSRVLISFLSLQRTSKNKKGDHVVVTEGAFDYLITKKNRTCRFKVIVFPRRQAPLFLSVAFQTFRYPVSF